MKSNWSISVFHYRNYGADVGKIVIGVLINKSEILEWDKFVKILGYEYWDESKTKHINCSLVHQIKNKVN